MQYGLIAEQVERNRSGTRRPEQGREIETVHYVKVNATLLNEIQKLHRLNQQLEGRVAELENRAR